MHTVTSTHRITTRRAVLAVMVALTLLQTVVITANAVQAPGATVSEPAQRLGATDLSPRFDVEPRHVVLISDSVFAGLRWTGAVEQLDIVDWRPYLESCRRLVFPSCNGREGYAPLTTQNEILRLGDDLGPISPRDYLIVGTGYNDSETRFANDFRAIVNTARAVGFRQIVWISYRENTNYRLPGDDFLQHGNYPEMNQILYSELDTGNYPDVRVWDFAAFSNDRPEWFADDGVHLTFDGAHQVARWMTSFFGPSSPEWIRGPE